MPRNPTIPEPGPHRTFPEGWWYSVASLNQLAEIASVACRGFSDERRKLVATILEDLVKTGEFRRILLVKAERIEVPGIEGAAIVVFGKDDSATLLGMDKHSPGLSEIDGARIMSGLVDFMHDILRTKGCSFVQAAREAEDLGRLLTDCGYEKLAILDYLFTSVSSSLPPSKLVWKNYSQVCERSGGETAGFLKLKRMVDATYEHSLDCPAIAMYRTTESVLRGYRLSPGYDPRLWFLCSFAEEGNGRTTDIGCLLLTMHPVGGAMEITYMGVRPQDRGLGVGEQILRKAYEEAYRFGCFYLTLAVDQQNCPALSLYQRHGFERLTSEAIWGRKIQ